MPGSLTEALDNLYTSTWQNMKGEVADQIFDATPFWFWLRQNGRLEAVPGGRFLTEPLRYAASSNVNFVRRGDALPLADKEFLTVAKEDWRYLADSIVRFGVDDQQNRGKNQILSLMNAKLENSRDSLVDTIETRLAGSAGTDQFNGLQDLIADAPATGTVHGINSATDTWWRNQTDDMTGVAFDALGVGRMLQMMNNCSNNLRMDRPDFLLTGQTVFQYYWEETITQRRVTNKTLGDAGFQNVEFMGTPLVWAPTIGTRIYFINSRFLRFKYDPQMFFDMTEWKAIPAQINDRVAQIVLAGNLMTSRRRTLGVMHTIDTAT